MPWHDVPAEVRAAVAELLGSPVVSATSQPGGFSPGSADRIVTADGRRAFIKTASTAVNAHSVEIHRREAAMAAALPASAHAPALRGFIDHGEWVAVVLEDVEGRHPQLPWESSELAAVLDALAELAREPVDGEFAGPSLEEATSGLFGGWRRLLESPAALLPLDEELGGWVGARLPMLAGVSEAAVADFEGDRLVHSDVRADNILIEADGRVVIVDWPWAARGVGWFDALSLLVNVRLYDPAADVERLIGEHPAFADMDPDAATRVLTGFAGYFVDASRQAPIPALPTLRRFQLDQGIAALEWLRERMG